MHKFMDIHCEKCSKFSHCNNNDLMCIPRYLKSNELQTELENLQNKCNEQESMIAYFQETEGKYSEYIYKQTLDKIKKVCEPIINISTIDKLHGEQYTGKYILAEQILQIIENELCIDK